MDRWVGVSERGAQARRRVSAGGFRQLHAVRGRARGCTCSRARLCAYWAAGTRGVGRAWGAHILAPGMQKTRRTPWASRFWTRTCAPVVFGGVAMAARQAASGARPGFVSGGPTASESWQRAAARACVSRAGTLGPKPACSARSPCPVDICIRLHHGQACMLLAAHLRVLRDLERSRIGL